MKIVYFLLYIYFLLKPYYIGESGGLQIADLFLVVAFLFFLLASKNIEKNYNMFNYKSIKLDVCLIFIICIFGINLIYSLMYLKIEFAYSILYYIFNIMAIIMLTVACNEKKFLKNIYNISIINIIVQLILYVSNLGRVYGGIRYMGTFNDPNQFAFYIFSSLMATYILKHILQVKAKMWTIAYMISFVLILASISTGLLMALVIFSIGLMVANIHKVVKIMRKMVLYVGICAIAVAFGEIAYISMEHDKNTNITQTISQSNVYKRLTQKVDKSQNSGNGLLGDREYNKIIDYPWKMIMGSGEGHFERYGNNLEIHATFPALLFYYGIGPLIILLLWIYHNIRGLPFKLNIVYIAIFIESFTLANQRQSMFWFIIILGSYYKWLYKGSSKNANKEELGCE